MDGELRDLQQEQTQKEEQETLQENMPGNLSGNLPHMELAASEPDSLMAEFSKDIENDFATAKQRLESSEFHAEAAHGFLQSLRTKVTKHRSLGCQHDQMEVAIIQRLKNGTNWTNFDIHQTFMYLCCTMAVYPKTLWLTLDQDKNLEWDFSSPSEGLFFLNLVRRVIGVIALIRNYEGLFKPEKYLSHLRQLLDIVALLERDVTNVAVFMLIEGFATATGIAMAATGRRAAKLINRTACLEVKTLFNESLIGQAWCLIRLGFLDIAEGIDKEDLHRVDRSCLSPRVASRLDYVQAVLLQERGNVKPAIDRAERALLQTQNAEDSQDIETLLQQLKERAASEEPIDLSAGDQPAVEWIEDCNIHQIENMTERQQEARQNHHKKQKHRRPHRRNPNKEERVPSVTSGSGVQNCATVAASNASLPTSKSRPRTTASNNRSSGTGSNDTRPIHSNCRSSNNSGDRSLKHWEEDNDDDEVVNDHLAQDIHLHDDYYVNDNDKKAVPIDSLAEDDERDWFEKSEAACNNYEDLNVDEEEVSLSESQIMDLQRGGDGREFYPTLKDKEELLKLLKMDSERYKRCQLKIEWSHKSIAKVLDKGSKYSEILIFGRSKAGQCYMDDEVVVEIVAEPGKSRGLHNAVSRFQGEDFSFEKMAHGKVIGLLNRVAFQNVEHPVLSCMLDELEGHLMRPLCKTVPKIHVMNDTVRRKYPALLKNRVEIKEIVDGRIQYKGFLNVKPEQREQYVFRVVLLSWRQRNIYPLGAVLGCTLSGRDYSGGLKVLSMQQRVPKLFPRSALEDTKKLLEQSVSRENRQDLTEKRIFTIDPPGSKDLDDAVSIDVKSEHFVIGVHIADVAAVVQKDSGLDLEARRRAVTFYPPERRPHPMLPEPISHGRCSLLPNQERAAFSVFFTFSQEGEQTEHPVVKRTIIKSCAQLTYKEVQKVVDGDTDGISICKTIQSDILLMHSITSKLREKRQKRSMLFMPFDDPRLVDMAMDHVADHMDAHSLIEELMILTNCYIGKRLNRTHHDLMIIRCHKTPTDKELQDWQEKGGSLTNLVMKMQGRKVPPGTMLSVDNFSTQKASPYQRQDIIVQKGVWEQLQRYLEDGEMDKARRLAFSDTLHPLQCLAANRWMDLMETAQYKCSYGLDKSDLYHFGLDEEVYTHFTSPIRRYADIHVQRLLHADLDGRSVNCTADEVTELCQHMNSATARQKAFSKGCMSLKIAESLQKQSLIFRAYVCNVDTEQLTLLVPSLLSLSDRKQELTFSFLGVSSQPELVTDTALRQDKVTVQWTRRVYDRTGFCPRKLASMWRYNDGQGACHSNTPVEMILCPDQLTVSVEQADWADILKTLITCNRNILKGVPLPVYHNSSKVEYMTSEKGNNTVCLRPVRYKRDFKEGQVVRLQMSALPSKGVLKPCVEMLQLARNVFVCMRHVSDPVLALTRHATRATRNKNFNNFSDYRKAWMPLLEMEAASGAGDSDRCPIIDNVKVNIKTQSSAAGILYKGVFHLPVSFCFKRSLHLGGKDAESVREEEEGRGEQAFPVDYLCLRYEVRCMETVVSRVRESSIPEAVDAQYMWLAHASVVDVTHKELKTKSAGSARVVKVSHKKRKPKNRGSLVVTFVLSPSSPPPPQSLLAKEGGKLTLEILPKASVDRRAQQMLLLLSSAGVDDLAKAIAFGSSISELDKDHKRQGQTDGNHEVRIPDNKWLPPNNLPQLAAIQKAMTNSLTMIQGPPGSGKTNTGIKLVYLFCQVNRKLMSEGKPRKTVLYCGPSNKAVDLVARELRIKLKDLCPKIVRVYGSAIESKDYPVPRVDLTSRRGMRDLESDPRLKKVSLHHIIRQSGKPYAGEIATFERLFKKWKTNPAKKTVTSKKHDYEEEDDDDDDDEDYKANMELKKYRKVLFDASVEELKHYEVVLCTCAVGGNMRLIKGLEKSVYQLIIDECAMSPEPQSMVPIVATGARQVVLIGDHKQLRPIIKCQPAAELGLDQSLFERLYQKYPAYTVFLSTQYRMHPDICAFPSKEFYEGKLQTGPSRLWKGPLLTLWPKHPKYPDRVVPHVIVDVRGEEETLTVGTEDGNERSKSNRLEVEKVVEILMYMKRWHSVDIQKVKILTQYNAQRHLLEQRLRMIVEQNVDGVFEPNDKDKVNSIVSTVVSSQGDECDYVILSTVRSLPSYRIVSNPTHGGGEWDYVILSTVRSLPSYRIEPNPTHGWCRQNLGFITDRNQVNVALTRARRGLVIVGNVELLRCDVVWRHLVEWYERLGCSFSGEPDSPKPFPPLPPQAAAGSAGGP